MPTVEVILSPALCDTFETKDKTIVVVDIFRATSTIAAALMSGVKSVLPILEAEKTITYKSKGYFIAGERNGKPLPNFDFANSPRLIQNPKLKGEKLALTTTNGTKCFTWAQGTSCKKIYCGSFINIQATAEQIKKEKNSVVILCAGWKNRVNLEDTLYAGALCNMLKMDFDTEGDGSLVAMDVEEIARNKGYLEYLRNSSHYQRLKNYGAEEDMCFALKENQFAKNIVLVNQHLILED